MSDFSHNFPQHVSPPPPANSASPLTSGNATVKVDAFFDGGLVSVRVNLRGPEPVRLIRRGGLYVVEVLSASVHQWIAQMETTDKAKGMEAVEGWAA